MYRSYLFHEKYRKYFVDSQLYAISKQAFSSVETPLLSTIIEKGAIAALSIFP